MPRDISSIASDAFKLSCLVLGFAKAGKTVSCIKSAVSSFGEGYVIGCSTEKHLLSAKHECPSGWVFDVVSKPEDMETCLREARRGVKEGKYKWVLLDDFNFYADKIEDQLKAANPGPSMYATYLANVRNVVLRLCDLPCHVISTMHFIEISDGEIPGQAPKKGMGIVPLLSGKAKSLIPAIFNQVVFMEKKRDDRRVFHTSMVGVWGPGVHGLKGAHEIPADLGELVKVIQNNKDNSQ